MLQGKVFLTGGTGTLGVSLLERAECEGWPCSFTVYSRDEVKQAQLRPRFSEQRFILGDVRDADWLQQNMRGHEIVIHAAACKRVPSIELNASDAIKTNVMGSLNVARAAVAIGAHHAVCISSDKACLPINLYGATKMAMERIWQEAGGWGDTAFHLVRYGNVIGSRGSVIPLFMKQVADGKPLTITDERMTRFWLTIDQGIDLILNSLSMPSGVMLVPMAKAMGIVELARCIAPGHPMHTIGIRPGEKLHEMLIHSAEALHTDLQDGTFAVWPRASSRCGNLPEGFEYTSDQAPHVTEDEMARFLDTMYRKG